MPGTTAIAPGDGDDRLVLLDRLVPRKVFHLFHRDIVVGDQFKEMIELGPVPVRVRDLVVRARADEKLILPVRGVRERTSLRMVEEAEAALQAAAHVGVGAPPGAPLREGQEAGEVVAPRELLEQEVRERRRGLADREARMRAFFEKEDRESEPSRHEREKRAGEAGAHDRDVEGAFHGRGRHEEQGGRGRFL